MRALATALVLLAACGSPPPSPPPQRTETRPKAPVAAPTSDQDEPAAWATRAIRTCPGGPWARPLATDTHVFACAGAIYDIATTRLTSASAERGMNLAATNNRIVWQDDRDGRLVVRDATQELARFRARDQLHGGVATPDGQRVMFVREAAGRARQPYLVELSSGAETVPRDWRRCARAGSFGVRQDGAIQCIERRFGARGEPPDPGLLITLGEPGEAEVGQLEDPAQWVPGRDVIVMRERGAIRWRTTAGEVIAERPSTDQHQVRGVRGDGSALVSVSRREVGTSTLERWWPEDGDVRTEPVWEGAVSDAIFAGDDVVVSRETQIVWLGRGGTWETPLAPPVPTPEGYTPAVANGHWFAYDSGRRAPRGPEDVAMFFKDWRTLLRVSRTDAAELAGLGRLEDWARAAMTRYLETGTDPDERWARAWEDADGNRVLRGHAYNRFDESHIDVVVRTRGEVLERYRASGHEPTSVDPFGVPPEGAIVVTDGGAQAE